MVGALGQHQHLATLAEGVLDFAGNCGRSGLIIGEVPEHILNSCVGREVDPFMHRIRYHIEVVRCTSRFCCCVPYRPHCMKMIGCWPSQHLSCDPVHEFQKRHPRLFALAVALPGMQAEAERLGTLQSSQLGTSPAARPRHPLVPILYVSHQTVSSSVHPETTWPPRN